MCFSPGNDLCISVSDVLSVTPRRQNLHARQQLMASCFISCMDTALIGDCMAGLIMHMCFIHLESLLEGCLFPTPYLRLSRRTIILIIFICTTATSSHAQVSETVHAPIYSALAPTDAPEPEDDQGGDRDREEPRGGAAVVGGAPPNAAGVGSSAAGGAASHSYPLSGTQEGNLAA